MDEFIKARLVKKYITHNIEKLQREKNKARFKAELQDGYENVIADLKKGRDMIEERIYDEQRIWVEQQASSLASEVLDEKKLDTFFKKNEKPIYTLEDINSSMVELRKRRAKPKKKKPKYFG